MARKSIRHMYNVPVILKFRRGRCLPIDAWLLTGMLQEIHSWVVFFCFFCFTVLSPVFVCSRLFLWRRRAVRAYARLAAAFLSNLSNPRRPHVQTFCVQIITTVYTLWVVDVLQYFSLLWSTKVTWCFSRFIGLALFDYWPLYLRLRV